MIVDEIYDGLTDEDALAALPAKLAAHVGARSCTLQAFSLDNQFLLMLQNGYFPEEMYDYYVAADMHRHDFWRPAFEQPGRLHRAYSAERLTDPRGYVDSTFYNDFFRRFGDDTGRFLGAVSPHAEGVFTIALQRGLLHSAFDETHERKLQPLIPHLRRVFEVRAGLAKATARTRYASDLLDALPQAVLVIDDRGRLEFANRRGEALLAPRGPITSSGGKVRAVEAQAEVQFAHLVRDATRAIGGHGGAMQLPCDDGRPLRAVISPWRSQGRRQVLVLIEAGAARDPSLSFRLAALYGLTPAESQTITALVEGLSPAETAASRGVALATIRTQIQHALRKSDARSMADLIRRVVSLPQGPRDG